MLVSENTSGAVVARPASDADGAQERWFADENPAASQNGTVVRASFLNWLLANLRDLATYTGQALTLATPAGDAQLRTMLLASTGLPTGTMIFGAWPAAPAGFVLMQDNTIGSAASGATARANADTVNLYTLLWDNFPDLYCPVVGGRGANAAADFTADKPLTLYAVLGRALAIAGSGSGLTARALGETLGEEAHAQLVAELASHRHNLVGSDVDSVANAQTGAMDAGAAANSWGVDTVAVQLQGSGTPFNVLGPRFHVNTAIKL